MGASLGGSLFVRNAIKYDYCVTEAIASLAALCDDVFVLDCQSDDGTTEGLENFCFGFSNVRYQSNGNWNCAQDFNRLRILANTCIDQLDTDWHFMLQADEVLHEDSFGPIRMFINSNHGFRTCMVRRFNLFGDVDHYINPELPQKPCGDVPIRLGKKGIHSLGDAENLDRIYTCQDWIQRIKIFHYGFVRKNVVEKAIDMQSWFWQDPSRVDSRLIEMDKRGVWEPHELIQKENLLPIPCSHPKFSKEWADARRS